jgi:hypothetical protein
MKSILYNTATNEIIDTFPNGYLVNGKPGILHEGIAELQYISSQPSFNPATHKADSNFVVDLVAKTYTQVWSIVPKSAYDFAIEAWHYPAFAKRIIAPVELVMQYPQVETWFRLNELPILRENATLFCYCNVILPAHQQLVDALQGIVTIENRPTE